MKQFWFIGTESLDEHVSFFSVELCIFKYDVNPILEFWFQAKTSFYCSQALTVKVKLDCQGQGQPWSRSSLIDFSCIYWKGYGCSCADFLKLSGKFRLLTQVIVLNDACGIRCKKNFGPKMYELVQSWPSQIFDVFENQEPYFIKVSIQ